jgi:hypothetical protein
MGKKLNSSTLAMFKSFEIKNIEKIKGGDDPNAGSLIGSDEIADA